DLSGIPNGAVITAVTLNLFISNSFGVDDAVLHGYAGNGTVEGADLGVSNPLLAFVVPTTGRQVPLSLDIAPPVLPGLIDGAGDYAGFTLRNTTAGGGVFSIYTTDWGDTAVHPTLAVEFQTAVPEPATLTLMALGLLGLAGARRSRTR